MLALLAALASAPQCTPVVNGTVLGDKSNTIGRRERVQSPAHCCAACIAFAGCRAWTWEADDVCYLKSSSAGAYGKSTAVSGCLHPADCPAPPPPPRPGVAVAVHAAPVSRTDGGFKCWNIDASPNRQWETRDLSNPLLHSLGRQSLPGYLRFGGSGNDGLPYALDMDEEGAPGNRCAAGSARCLNRTWVDNLANFAAASGARLVFGLNIDVCAGGAAPCRGRLWDGREARVLMRHLIRANHTVYGFELGNEQNTVFSPAAAAASFRVLSQLLIELYPDAATRPRIIGPDVHGFHADPRTSRADGAKLEYLAAFARNCSAAGVPLHALTHHEYVEVPENPTAPPPFQTLDITTAAATAANATLSAAAPGVQIWAGEIGPHNGGSPGCSPSSERWAGFADSHWYLDSMGAKAAHGYSVFCRQDFVGIDYGMLDCSTYAPLPDYFSGILWSRLMGSVVLRAASDSPTLRSYAHCAPGAAAGVATLLLINLEPTLAREVTVEGLAVGGQRREWHLTGPGGAASPRIALNGAELKARVQGDAYELPPLPGATRTGGTIALAPASIAFVQLEGVPACR